MPAIAGDDTGNGLTWVDVSRGNKSGTKLTNIPM